jgi:hypothetical protein
MVKNRENLVVTNIFIHINTADSGQIRIAGGVQTLLNIVPYHCRGLAGDVYRIQA